MPFARYITIGQQPPRNLHRVTDHDAVSVCICGWSGAFDDATEHLYGGLTGAARRFVEGQIHVPQAV